MENKNSHIVERFYSQDKETDFISVLNLIINNKIDDLVHNASKVNTATFQYSKKGNENNK
ncbi:hypothetical protein GLW08_19640 [Pontibacillus yanchengensis]|uniref:Uncharacterized protein n=2 Tax=Pontibacillus yanchengensis TaxID=462910 RepID=A0ACC7VKL7_9BACI|nr:hypothetical protein [Pontibacillus yanchengensis]MYL35538.1 hypothetical protein [Pontibacillus yanchengensis]MYL55521.1 hypothetical protein [Pontibacillus yanchengensis]